MFSRRKSVGFFAAKLAKPVVRKALSMCRPAGPLERRDEQAMANLEVLRQVG